MRYMIAHKVTKQIIHPTMEQQQQSDEGKALDIDQHEYDKFIFVLQSGLLTIVKGEYPAISREVMAMSVHMHIDMLQL